MKMIRGTKFKRKTVVALLMAAALSLGVIFAWPRISYRMLTGRFYPVHKIESLHNPVAVKGWTPDGLLLGDSRVIQIPGFRQLPEQSLALSEATQRGIEITGDGRVFGLMKIHHWCGNDPVREHIVRVDISEVLMFLNLGETIGPIPEEQLTTHEKPERFSEWGWNVSDFFQFQGWQLAKKVDNESDT